MINKKNKLRQALHQPLAYKINTKQLSTKKEPINIKPLQGRIFIYFLPQKELLRSRSSYVKRRKKKRSCCPLSLPYIQFLTAKTDSKFPEI